MDRKGRSDLVNEKVKELKNQLNPEDKIMNYKYKWHTHNITSSC